jgi:hypothetical protein
VFLTDRHVYKLKKPLRGQGFDFTTPAARRRNAEAEVRLNRRLAAAVYLGVVPLTLDRGGNLAIGGKGCAVDWLVKMIRLPASRMLDNRLARGDLCHADINALADRLARFYATARRCMFARRSALTDSNAARAAQHCKPAAGRCCSTQRNMSPEASRPSSCAAKTYYCGGSMADNWWKATAIFVPSISIWDRSRGLSIASNSALTVALWTPLKSSRF